MPSKNTIPSERAPQCHTHTSHQLFRSEWFGDVVVGTEIERRDFVLLGAAGGKNEDRCVGALANLTADLQAVHVRQPEIENDEIRPVPPEEIDRLASGPGNRDRIPARAEQRRHRALNRQLVVDQKNMRRTSHNASPSSTVAARLSAGTAIVTTAPPCGWFDAQMRPPSAATSPLAIVSPIPVPNRCSCASAPR